MKLTTRSLPRLQAAPLPISRHTRARNKTGRQRAERLWRASMQFPRITVSAAPVHRARLSRCYYRAGSPFAYVTEFGDPARSDFRGVARMSKRLTARTKASEMPAKKRAMKEKRQSSDGIQSTSVRCAIFVSPHHSFSQRAVLCRPL